MTQARDYDRVAHAIRYIARHRLEQPTLEEVAEAMGLSPFHAQRLFTRWAGLSPKRFLGLLTVEHAKELLRGAESVMGAAYEVGLSGPSRLHDLFLTFEAMTPGEYKEAGAKLILRWGVHETPFGQALLVASERGLARLVFLEGQTVEEALVEAKADWPLSRFVADTNATAPFAHAAFGGSATRAPLKLLLKGTPFQVQVWRALMRIPEGTTVTYGQLAAELGRPGAARAIGSACGRNRIGVLIPCHRVIRDTGALGGYHWGLERKQALLAWESARRLGAEDETAARPG
ncbi:bifunctional helix-turn-helix domain-containing protein/methylated-DNA--[protein]-cysteine S-methyltransferase [Benzoatithermus flavus]|uniref:Methylated-DNA--[protein]-cysteine S-methyltransferase n=1 Tax=Benzoatithermus flavus TaxID=3108223 RepID=A0ABU8XWS3_9PROT